MVTLVPVAVCFDFCLSAECSAEYDIYVHKTDLRRQPVTEPEPMASPINYPAYLDLILLNFFESNNRAGQINIIIAGRV